MFPENKKLFSKLDNYENFQVAIIINYLKFNRKL